MDATARFGALVQSSDPPLDEGALLIAAHAYPDLDIEQQRVRLDFMASRLTVPTRGELCRVVFGEFGLHGNSEDYYDPRNSFLNDVLDRGVGIPITLAIVMIEVGRRAGIALEGVGMPGHFLVRDAADGALLDPFNRGEQIEVADVVAPGDNRSILYRMLTNLRAIYLDSDDDALRWVLRLRTAFPDAPRSHHQELLRANARLN